jgi:hypothetical protein
MTDKNLEQLKAEMGAAADAYEAAEAAYDAAEDAYYAALAARKAQENSND